MGEKNNMKLLFPLFLVLASLSFANAQIQVPLFSEPAEINQQIGLTHFKIKYERPKRNDRLIFGGLVPFDKVWRTGSSECTKIYFDQPVTLNDTDIASGCYSLFTIPGKEEWTIILNKDTSLYGAYDYDSKLDVVRFQVPAKTTTQWREAFNINIDVLNDEALISLQWEFLNIEFKIETNTYENILGQANDIITNDYDLEEGEYTLTADYIIHNKSGFGPEYLNIVEQLINKAFKIEGENSYNYRCKRDILKIQNNKAGYTKVSNDHINFLLKNKPYEGYELDVAKIRLDIKAWK